jgi:hypothetical protein
MESVQCKSFKAKQRWLQPLVHNLGINNKGTPKRPPQEICGPTIDTGEPQLGVP